MDPLFFVVLALGLAVGSFLNVLITRLPDPHRTLLRPAQSHCPTCDTAIRPRDNVPVLGYLLLRGRCRACAEPISPVYPIVEILTATVFAGAYWAHGPTAQAAHAALFLVLLLAIAVTDAQTYLIPDLYTLGGGLAGLGVTAWAFGLGDAIRHAADAAAVAAILFGLGWLVTRVAGREALGFGDVLMVGMMATFLGFGPTVVAIYLGAVSGVVFYVVHRRLNAERLIPFGLHLAVGGALSLLIGATDYSQMFDSALPWY